jgi:hypothetical protein
MCDSCNAVSCETVYNGQVLKRVVHERGCPSAWKTATRRCKECGQAFTPEERNQRCCSPECTEAYFG